MKDLFAGTVYIGVESYSGQGDYLLAARIHSEQPTPIPLTEGQSYAGSLSFTMDEDLFALAVEKGIELNAALSGPPESDFDLYLKFDGHPSLSDYDARGFGASSSEQCRIETPSDGMLYVLVKSHDGSGDYTLKVDRAQLDAASGSGMTPSKEVVMVKGRIVDQQTGEGLHPNRFCLSIKGLSKFCYARGATDNAVSFLPGGYFWFNTGAMIGTDLSLRLSDIPCHEDLEVIVGSPDRLSYVEFHVDVDASKDCDEDGMPSEWEKQYALDILKNDAAFDLDEDGHSNLEEYRAGTDPSDKQSKPGPSKARTKADINQDGRVDLADVVISLRALTGKDVSGLMGSDDGGPVAGLDGNGKVGLQEASYALQIVSEMR